MSEVTKRALASSLRRLLMKEPLDKITIKELTDDCGISRSAFYYHFQDIYELVEWTTFEKLGRKLSKSVEEGNWKEIIRTIVTDFDEDRQFVLTVYHYINYEMINKYVDRAMNKLMPMIMGELPEGLNVTKSQQQMVLDFFRAGMEGTLFQWVGNGMKESADEVISRLILIPENCLKPALCAYDKQNRTGSGRL